MLTAVLLTISASLLTSNTPQQVRDFASHLGLTPDSCAASGVEVVQAQAMLAELEEQTSSFLSHVAAVDAALGELAGIQEECASHPGDSERLSQLTEREGALQDAQSNFSSFLDSAWDEVASLTSSESREALEKYRSTKNFAAWAPYRVVALELSDLRALQAMKSTHSQCQGLPEPIADVIDSIDARVDVIAAKARHAAGITSLNELFTNWGEEE